MVETNNPSQSGVFHLTCQGKTSWHGFAKEILSLSGMESTALIPIPTSDYPTPAIRPLFSLLCNEKIKNTFNIQLPHWQEALKNCLISS